MLSRCVQIVRSATQPQIEQCRLSVRSQVLPERAKHRELQLTLRDALECFWVLPAHPRRCDAPPRRRLAKPESFPALREQRRVPERETESSFVELCEVRE